MLVGDHKYLSVMFKLSGQDRYEAPIPLGVGYHLKFEVADLDNDGDIDIVAADAAEHLVKWINPCDGNLVAPQFIDAEMTGIIEIALCISLSGRSLFQCADWYSRTFTLGTLADVLSINRIVLTKAISKSKVEKNNFVVNGGRIIHLVAEGKNIHEAKERAYAAMSHVFIEGNALDFRTDIGWKELARHFS